jgi:hypothetical protein
MNDDYDAYKDRAMRDWDREVSNKLDTFLTESAGEFEYGYH